MPHGYKKDGTPSNPSGKGGFKDRPQDINRGGFTKAQREQHYKQHNKALEIREKQLDALWQVIEDSDVAGEILATVRPEINALLKDALDRWQGAPGQNIDITSNGESVKATGMDAFYTKLNGDDGE